MFQGILFLVYSISFAQMNLGFYPKESQEIPVEVQAARAKIYKIKSPYYITLKASEYQPMLDGPKIPANTKEAIRLCQSQNKDTCVVPFVEIQGTAFLGKTPDTIWTNCHIVHPWMSFASRGHEFTTSDQVRAFFSKIPMPITLETSDGVPLLGSSDVATLKAFSAPANFPLVDGVCNAQDDLVKIKLTKSLDIKGLPWAQDTTASLYMGGFPHKTETRQQLGKIDSDGENFFWSFGPSLDKKSDEGIAYLSNKPNSDLAVAGAFLETLLADGVEGMSGSPVLTNKGEVVGIYKGYVPLTQEQRDIPFVSLYVTTSGMRFIEILSGE